MTQVFLYLTLLIVSMYHKYEVRNHIQPTLLSQSSPIEPFIRILQNLLSGTRAVSRRFFPVASSFNTLEPERCKLNVEPSLWLFVNRPNSIS